MWAPLILMMSTRFLCKFNYSFIKLSYPYRKGMHLTSTMFLAFSPIRLVDKIICQMVNTYLENRSHSCLPLYLLSLSVSSQDISLLIRAFPIPAIHIFIGRSTGLFSDGRHIKHFCPFYSSTSIRCP